MNKLLIIMVSLLLFSAGIQAFATDVTEEKIVYTINGLGKAEYNDLGVVDYQNRKLKLTTFHTIVTGFKDLEKIYSDPETGLPFRVERSISWPLSKEYITEEYFSETNSLVVKKYKNDKLVKEYSYKAKGPIHNAILLPFSLRKEGDFQIGWSFDVRFPDEYKITLSSIEEIKVNAKKFMAYHFTSEPPKFEIWISKDKYRIPLVIKGSSGLGYTMRMLSHLPDEK